MASSTISARERRLRNKISAPKSARDWKCDNEQMIARSDAHSTQAESCDNTAFHSGV